MEQDPSKSLVSPSNSGGLEKAGSGLKRILSLMMTDALVLARKKERALTQPRRWIGDQELRDADYRQILNWAEALGMAPEVVLKQLSAAKTIYEQFKIVDCAIHTLIWDFTTLPILAFNWLSGLRIEVLVFRGRATAEIAPRLPTLKKLECSDNQLTELDLAYVPGLANLECGDNHLRNLNLAGVPQLTYLSCSYNQLTELDLACVPQLTDLWCDDNQLTELNLACVPQLTDLWCSDNQLTELDMACVPQLTVLSCSDNQLTELGLARAPDLRWLYCNKNQLTDLDITNLKQLNRFHFDPSVQLKKLSSQKF